MTETLKIDANGIVTRNRPTEEISPNEIRICRAFLERCGAPKPAALAATALST